MIGPLKQMLDTNEISRDLYVGPILYYLHEEYVTTACRPTLHKNSSQQYEWI